MNIEELLEIEAIKQLKARYFRLMDTKQWDAWADVFAEDFTGLYQGPHPDIEFNSKEEMVSSNRALLADVVTVHQGHTPEIEITGADTAAGIWAMYDRVEMQGNEFEAFGHYHDHYRKIGGEWKISKIKLTRLKVSPLNQSGN